MAASVLVKVQTTAVPFVSPAAGSVTVPATRSTAAVAPPARPVQVAPENAKPPGIEAATSVSTVCVFAVVSVLMVPTTVEPDTETLMLSEPKPLVPLNAKVPVPPSACLRICTVGRRLLL
ncbi:hypothetical protein D9M72_513200 [compost metagenome]